MATWREFAYLTGLFVPLVIVGGLVLIVWLTLALGVTLPLWYWAPVEHYPHGLAVHGVQLGYFPNARPARARSACTSTPCPRRC